MVSSRRYTILAPSFAKWRGSDALALAQELRKLGHTLIEIDEEDFIPWWPQGTATRIARRLLRPVLINEYNQAVVNQAENSRFDFVLSFKGGLLKPETVLRLRESDKPVYNFYPDVSFLDHGPRIPAALKHYDCIFTTKSYHDENTKRQFGIRRLAHVRHGFDPEVHRPVGLTRDLLDHYGCDVSFVGCWSAEKEARLHHLLKALPNIVLKVFGLGWHYASNEFRQRMGSNLRPGVFGDELAIVYGASKVNLGLLSRSKSDPELQDQTTARTFQIPASRAFMLHEDTAEARQYFVANEEAVFFTDDDELVKKLKEVLAAPEMRASIADAGYRRCLRDDYDYSSAARSIVGVYDAQTGRSVAQGAPKPAKAEEFVTL